MGGGGDHIAVLEGVGGLLGGDQTGDVSHIHHHHGSVGVSDLADAGVVPLTRIGGSSAHNQLGLEDASQLLHLVVVHQTGLGVHVVGESLEEDGGSGQSLALLELGAVDVVTVGEVTSRGQSQTHNTATRAEKTGVDGEVGGRSRVGLDVHSPLGGVEVVSLESTLLAELLNLVNELVTSVVTVSGVTLRILVGEARSQAFHDSSGGEVLRIRLVSCNNKIPQRQSSQGTSRNGSSPSQ